MKLLTKEFLDKYSDEPDDMNQLSKFVFYRTYSRWVDSLDRRETFKEAISRAVEYNVGISVKHISSIGYDVPENSIREEAETLFDNIYNRRQFLSGRTHWIGGADTGISEKSPMSNFNCAFLEISKWEDLSELFYLLLIGTGVGVKCFKEDTKKLAHIRRDYNLTHSEFKPVPKESRLEETLLKDLGNGYAKIYIADSKEGWIKALDLFFKIITDDSYSDIKNIKMSYNSIRPRGERLKTFGGTASGYETIKDMFIGIDNVLKDKLDMTLEPMREIIDVKDDIHIKTGRFEVRPIHILDIINLIGVNVVCGGVRRTAEIFLCEEDDYEVIFAKYGLFGIDEAKHQELAEKLYAIDILPNWWSDERFLENRKTLLHRTMSNNSIIFENKPSKEYLSTVIDLIKLNGEPGFINLEEARRRRPNAKGVNPCGEVLLDSKQVCNLTTINVKSFVKDGKLDLKELFKAQALSARAGMRMTLLDLEMWEWDAKQKRDRIIGVSLTGWKDMVGEVGLSEDEENGLLDQLKEVAILESMAYANSLRIAFPLLATTVKPEGTLSQVAGGVSSGLHTSHAPYFIRRVRINNADPIAELVKKLGWDVSAEYGTSGVTDLEELKKEDVIKVANTIVVSFPIKSTANKTKVDETVEEQFETYLQFQRFYTQHNSSNTITVKEDEWGKIKDLIFDNWDEFVGVSLLADDGSSYPLMPYEEINEDEYNRLLSDMGEFKIEDLFKIEKKETEKDLENMQECSSGVCPII